MFAFGVQEGGEQRVCVLYGKQEKVPSIGRKKDWSEFL